MFCCFANKPVHLDETNFLALTTGTFLGPHSVYINWQGTQEPAFDVLSNPPGIAWFLWPVRSFEIAWQRVWVLPWSLLAVFGVWRFGQETIKRGFAVTGLLLASPFFWISNGSLMPDMALFACIVVGFTGSRVRENGKKQFPFFTFPKVHI